MADGVGAGGVRQGPGLSARAAGLKTRSASLNVAASDVGYDDPDIRF